MFCDSDEQIYLNLNHDFSYFHEGVDATIVVSSTGMCKEPIDAKLANNQDNFSPVSACE